MAPLGELWGQRDDSIRTRKFWNDERSQSVVIGTILTFAIGILLLAVLQTTLIPSANEDVEAKHSQEVRGEMQDLRNDIVRSAGSGADFSQGVKLGTEYPTRAFFLNPGPAAGSLNTQGTTDTNVDINIRNAQALDEETADYWSEQNPNGPNKDYGTGAVVYRPGYNIYSSAPEAIIIENSLSYSEFDNGNTILSSNQRFVSGKRIFLVALDGELSESRTGQVTVDTTAVSASTNTITIEEDPDVASPNNIEIDVATRLSSETIVQDVLTAQIDDPDGPTAAPESGEDCSSIDPSADDNERYVVDCSVTSGPGSFNTLTLTMEAGEVYTLKLAKIGVGSGATPTDPEYITDISGDGASVPEAGTQTVTVEVRDEFNNPVVGEEVELKIPSGDGEFKSTGLNTVTRRTDEKGQIKATYVAPTTVNTKSLGVDIQASYDTPIGADFAEEDPEDALVELNAINGSQVNRTQPLINPNNKIILRQSLVQDENTDKCNPGNVECKVTVQFEDVSTMDGDTQIDKIRYAFYSTDSQGTSPIVTHETANLVGPNPGTITLEFGGAYKPTSGGANIIIPSGGTEKLTFEFEDRNGDPAAVEAGDFFVISFIIDGERATYFVAPEDPSGGT